MVQSYYKNLASSSVEVAWEFNYFQITFCVKSTGPVARVDRVTADTNKSPCCSGMDGSLSVGSAGSQAHTMGMDRSLTPGGKSNVSNANVVNSESTEVKPRSLRFTWSMKTTSSRDPNEIMAEIKKVCGGFLLLREQRC